MFFFQVTLISLCQMKNYHTIPLYSTSLFYLSLPSLYSISLFHLSLFYLIWRHFCYIFLIMGVPFHNVGAFLLLFLHDRGLFWACPPPLPPANISAGAHVYLSSLLPPLSLHYIQLSCACSLFSSLPPSTSLLPPYFFAYDTQCSNLQRHKSVHLTSSRYVCDKLITAFKQAG